MCDIDHYLCVYILQDPYVIINQVLFGVILIVHLVQMKDPPFLRDIDDYWCVYILQDPYVIMNILFFVSF